MSISRNTREVALLSLSLPRANKYIIPCQGLRIGQYIYQTKLYRYKPLTYGTRLRRLYRWRTRLCRQGFLETIRKPFWSSCIFHLIWEAAEILSLWRIFATNQGIIKYFVRTMRWSTLCVYLNWVYSMNFPSTCMNRLQNLRNDKWNLITVWFKSIFYPIYRTSKGAYAYYDACSLISRAFYPNQLSHPQSISLIFWSNTALLTKTRAALRNLLVLQDVHVVSDVSEVQVQVCHADIHTTC